MRSILITFLFLFIFPTDSLSQKNNTSIFEDSVGFYSYVINPVIISYGFQIEYISSDFNDFNDIIGNYNSQILSGISVLAAVEFGVIYKRFNLSFRYGISPKNEGNYDSLYLKTTTNSIGFNIGYNIIDSKYFIIEPNLSFKWYRFRLLNFDEKRKIPLYQYLDNRDVDLRFSQVIGYLGCDFSYKINNQNFLWSNYMSVGIYSGYLFKLNDKPWIYSRGNRLISNSKIEFKNFALGITVNLYYVL